VALVGAAPPSARPSGFDPRVYALSPGNVAFLRSLGVWSSLPAERISPVHRMRIFGDDERALLEFDAYQGGVSELAWIVEDAELQGVLWAGLASNAERCERIEFAPNGALVSFAGGASISAQLVVGADGAHSFVRDAAGIPARERDYGHAALVANFRCERSHANTAYQWFQGGPVLALLPLPGEHVSMVWSVPLAEAERLAALEPHLLAEEVTQASKAVLGALALASPVRSFPLRHLSARRLVAPRVALVGDAGHVIHPLAGQGLNLGLQDARVLAQVLNEREPGRDVGDYRLLRRYERRRAEPILAMDAVVSALFALYGTQDRLLRRLRNAGLNLTDRLPVLKNILMRQAMS
jgi:2-polyprenylphenol 6-hydroxylase